jgi:16S rRNA processing protein RimM
MATGPGRRRPPAAPPPAARPALAADSERAPEPPVRPAPAAEPERAPEPPVRPAPAGGPAPSAADPTLPAGGPWLHAGRVGRPHGLDGSFHVTRPQPALLAASPTLTVDGRAEHVERLAGTDARPIVRLASCTSRTAAEALRGRDLLVARAAAPPLDEDEWWPEELEGCRVHDGAREVGIVRALRALPSCEVLEVVRDAGGDELLVPLIRDAVRTVDVVARRIDVDLAFLGET